MRCTHFQILPKKPLLQNRVRRSNSIAPCKDEAGGRRTGGYRRL
jgi:hypothetical protein